MDISSSESLSPNNTSILVFSIPSLSPSLLLSVPLRLYFLLFILISHHIPLIYIFLSFIHSPSHSHTLPLYFQPPTPTHLPTVYLLHLPPSQLVSDSPLVFHLPSILAHSRCHCSVLASLSFSYQTELIWLPYQGWVQTGAGQRLPLPS